MKTYLQVVFALVSLLLSLNTVKADQPEEKLVQQESIKIFNDDDSKVVGVLIVDRSTADGKVRSLFYSGPPDIIVRQAEPWARWHKEAELAEVHLSLTSVNAGLFSYLSKIETLDTLRIEDCIFEAGAEAALGKLSMLRSLEIDFATDFSIQSWSFLGNLTELNELFVVGDVVTADFAREFKSMTNLKNLEFWIDDQTKLDVLPELTALEKIERIQITRVASR